MNVISICDFDLDNNIFQKQNESVVKVLKTRSDRVAALTKLSNQIVAMRSRGYQMRYLFYINCGAVKNADFTRARIFINRLLLDPLTSVCLYNVNHENSTGVSLNTLELCTHIMMRDEYNEIVLRKMSVSHMRAVVRTCAPWHSNPVLRECLLNLHLDPHLNYTWQEIRVHYNKLILQHHPDKGGDSNNFIRIQQAFNKLRDHFCFCGVLEGKGKRVAST